MSQNLKQKSKIQIGNVKIDSCCALAPMAGITDVVLRGLVRRFSKTCLLTTEMISSESLMQNIDHSKILAFKENEHPLAYQISGHKPHMMAKAAQILAQKGGADIIDINMGCPVKKVVTGGDGSALMRTPQLASDIVKAVKDATELPVTVKFRLGYTAEEQNFLEFAKLMEESGADAMTIHCRTRSQMYSGKADWKAISNVKKEIKVPLFVNGDITDPLSAKQALEESNADGVAIARGVLGNPDLINRIEHYLNTGELLPELSFDAKIELIKDHLDDEVRLRGEKTAIQFVRKFYPYYIKGTKGASHFRGRLVTETRYVKIMILLNTIAELAREYG
ncbi:MAG: tRNA dihydrouridine synthase DusB [Clostridium sp.]|nr:tRNA dihydrouridine synthase DusB [Clostridium sp.]